MAAIDTRWSYSGLQVVRLENDLLRVDSLPEAGGKIYNFIHKLSGRNLLWHNPYLPPARNAFGAPFDDNWSGGWDELLPNDLPRPAPGGDLLPDHGEFWSQSAEWKILEETPGCCQVSLLAYGRVLPTRFEKILTLSEGEPFLRIHYRLSNLAPHPIDFLWNIHPALSVSANSWIDIPARQAVTDPWRETTFIGNSAFTWPFATSLSGQQVDLRQVVGPEAAQADMHYLVEVQDGWYAVTEREAQVGFALRFPITVFPHVWLFRALGGWRGFHTLILEASTGYPYDLEVAARNGTCGHLGPGESLEAEVLAIAYAAMTGVSEVRPDGTVVPV